MWLQYPNIQDAATLGYVLIKNASFGYKTATLSECQAHTHRVQQGHKKL
jgi:hypothetical protein